MRKTQTQRNKEHVARLRRKAKVLDYISDRLKIMSRPASGPEHFPRDDFRACARSILREIEEMMAMEESRG